MVAKIGTVDVASAYVGTTALAKVYVGTAEVWSASSVPGAPTGLNTVSGDSQVAVLWTAPSPGSSAITDYTIQYRTTAGPGSWTTFTRAPSTAAGDVITGLTNGTSYDFQIAAINAVGTGPYSSPITATPAIVNSVSWNFTQSNGDAAGWTAIDSMPNLQVVGNRLQGTYQQNSSEWNRAYWFTALDLTGEFQVDYDCWATLTSGNGYVYVAILSEVTGDGYTALISNAVHIYPVTGLGLSGYITNDPRTVNQNHVTWTRTAAGAMAVYLDGVLTSTTTDTSKTTGSLVVVSIRAGNYPTEVPWLDNLVVKDSIG